MSTLWPRNRPLNQPSHYGRIGAQPGPDKPCPVQTAAERTLRVSQAARREKQAQAAYR